MLLWKLKFEFKQAITLTFLFLSSYKIFSLQTKNNPRALLFFLIFILHHHLNYLCSSKFFISFSSFIITSLKRFWLAANCNKEFFWKKSGIIFHNETVQRCDDQQGKQLKRTNQTIKVNQRKKTTATL